MTTLFVCRDVHYCEVDGGAIFLDLRTNRYLGTSASTLPALRSRVCGWRTRQSPDEIVNGCEAAGESCLEDLIARRLLTRVESEGHAPGETVVPATRSLGMKHRDTTSWSSGLGFTRTFIQTWLATSWRLKRGQLGLMIEQAARANSATPHALTLTETERCVTLTLAYRRLRPWLYRAREKCLLDSLVLTTFLHHYGIPATLVLGVAPKPFTAHAWVQFGTIVLNDKAEHVQMYTPIVSA